MKQISLAVNAVLLVAVLVLYILFFQYKSSNPKRASANKAPTSETTQLTNIAYFNTDSVNSKVDYIKRNADAMAKKEKNLDAELKRRAEQGEQASLVAGHALAEQVDVAFAADGDGGDRGQHGCLG